MKEVAPVPPPGTVSVPVTDGVNVSVSTEPVMVSAEVTPLATDVDVASVTVGPSAV